MTSTTLLEHSEVGRCVRVIQLENGARMYLDGMALYTYVDAGGTNLVAYIDNMNSALAGVSSVLVLGTAGGALPTLLSRRGVKVTALDNWSTAFEIARQWFNLPADVECVQADAFAFLRSTTRQWDAIAVDLYRGVHIPGSILANDIGLQFAKALKPGGLVVWNVADTPRSWMTKWVSRALKRAGYPASVHSVDQWDGINTLVVGRSIRTES